MTDALPREALRWICDPDRFGFTTDEVDPEEGIVGQARATEALTFALAFRAPNQHVFVRGNRRGDRSRGEPFEEALDLALPSWCHPVVKETPDSGVARATSASPPGALHALRVRAALQADTLLTVAELEMVLPGRLVAWVLEQVDPCSSVAGEDLYEWADVRGTLADPPRPKAAQANQRRRARPAEEATPRGHLTVNEAAAELGISDRTLRKRLLDDAVHQVRGGPIDVSTGAYKHWRFPANTLHDWWREVNAKGEPPAKAPKRRRPKERSRPTGALKKIDWAAAARGDMSR